MAGVVKASEIVRLIEAEKGVERLDKMAQSEYVMYLEGFLERRRAVLCEKDFTKVKSRHRG